jgi:hypothetical protein
MRSKDRFHRFDVWRHGWADQSTMRLCGSADAPRDNWASSSALALNMRRATALTPLDMMCDAVCDDRNEARSLMAIVSISIDRRRKRARD